MSGNSLTACGVKEWTIKNQDNTIPIDSAVFTLNIATTTASKTITVLSSDTNKVATYNLEATVKYKDYPLVISPAVNFNIVVADPCTAAIINFSQVVPSTSVTYTIGASGDVQTFDLTKLSHDQTGKTCPVFQVVLYDVVNDQKIQFSTLTQDIFAYDSGKLTTLTNDLAKAGTYDILMKAKFSGNAYTYQSGDQIQFTLTNPCKTAVISFATNPFSSINY